MKNPSRLLIASLALLALTVLRAEDKSAAPAKPAAPAPAAALNVTGTWNVEVQTGQGTGTPVFTFKQDGEKLTGHYKGAFGEADVTGSLKGADITFNFKTSPQGQELDCTYTGTVTGDTMKGTAKFANFGEATFTGKKQAAK